MAEIYLHRKIGDTVDNNSAGSICAAVFSAAKDRQKTLTAVDDVVRNFKIETDL